MATNPRAEDRIMNLASCGLGFALLALLPIGWAADPVVRPNVVIIYTDDMGYADVACFGARGIRTPRLDRMATDGMKLTSFYAQPVCGPSRGALLTGRYPNRIGGGWETRSEEITMAEMLRAAGYATACIGKWDISYRQPVDGLVPNDQGFDYYFGTLGGNDGGRVQLWRNREKLYSTDDMGSLTRLYTDEAIAFLRKQHGAPFFLYLAHTMPHHRIGASSQFLGKSAAGLYGDVIEELDWNIGRVIDEVAALGLARKTLIIFASDNGPWLSKGDASGSAWPLRGGKGSAWEGGFRVPAIVCWPGRVSAGVTSNEIVCTMDLAPTIAAFTGAHLPTDRPIDGRDQSAFLTGEAGHSAREHFGYFVRGELHAVRQGRWKLALPDRKEFYPFAQDKPAVTHPELYDLEADVAESHDVSAAHPEVVAALRVLAGRIRAEVGEPTPVSPSLLKGRKNPL